MKHFELTDHQWQRYVEWAEMIERDYPMPSTAIGGRFTFTFAPNTIGQVCTVRASMGRDEALVLDLTDYESW